MKCTELGLYPGMPDATLAWQSALTTMATTGGKLELIAGSYRIRHGGVLDLWRGQWEADEYAVSIVGDGSGCTEVICEGPEPALTVVGGSKAAQIHLRNRISGIKFRGAKGLYIQEGAYFEVNDVYLFHCDDALTMIDTLSCELDRVMVGWCKRGVLLKRNQFSHPNAITLRGCIVGCSEWGLQMHGGSSLLWHGGSLEGCGVGGVSWERYAMKIIHAGYEGSVALNFRDVYIEATHGSADVWLVGGPRPAVYNISGSTFGRIDPKRYAWHPIRIDCEEGMGKMTVNVSGCGFWGANGYQPSPSRKYIARTGTGPLELNHKNRGNYYQDTAEIPHIGT